MGFALLSVFGRVARSRSQWTPLYDPFAIPWLALGYPAFYRNAEGCLPRQRFSSWALRRAP